MSTSVQFNGNGATSGTMSSQSSNSPASLYPNQFVRNGFTFIGWNTLANGNGTPYADNAMYNFGGPNTPASQTLYAQWRLNTYTIAYDSNGATYGSVPTSQSGLAGTAQIISDNIGDLQRPFSCFLGWNTNPDGSGTFYLPNAIVVLHGSLQLYAQWGCDNVSTTCALPCNLLGKRIGNR